MLGENQDSSLYWCSRGIPHISPLRMMFLCSVSQTLKDLESIWVKLTQDF